MSQRSSRRVAAAGLVALAAVGCGSNATSPRHCTAVDNWCSSGNGIDLRTWGAVGFPRERVDFDDVDAFGVPAGRLAVGDSVVLYFLIGPFNTPVHELRDTVRTATWTVYDDAVARIRTGPAGRGVLVGVTPGLVHLWVTSGDQGWDSNVYSCEGGECVPVRVMVGGRESSVARRAGYGRRDR